MGYIEDNKETVDWIRRELKAAGLSQSAIGNAIGYSSTVVNQFFSGKYTGDARNVLERLVSLVKTASSARDLLKTAAYKSAYEFLDLVRSSNKMGVMLGDSGVGKTKICRAYAQNEGVAYCEIVQAMNSREVLKGIADSILSSPPVGTVYECQVAIQQALRQRPKMIIIDQADLLSIKTLDILRSIHDDGHCAMVFSGLPYLATLMKRGPRTRENLAYLYSRVGLIRGLPKANRDDVVLFAKKFGLDLSAELVDELIKFMRNAGEYRILENVFDEAKKLKGKVGRCDDDAVLAAKSLVMNN